MRLFSKKCTILLIFLILLIALTLFNFNLVNKKYINIGFGIILIILLSYEIITEIGENYEDKPQNELVLKIVNKLKKAHPEIEKVVPNLKFFEGRKSYTINKKYVFICLKDEKGQLYHNNQLVLVILHEIAHALCDEIGHTDKFQSILDDLLISAENVGLYDSTIPHIPNYCEY
jgi:histidyl-tRNA synthetase